MDRSVDSLQNSWAHLAAKQAGMLARRQLRSLRLNSDHVRNQVNAQRWAIRSNRVISTFTGPLHWNHKLWLGVLHAGGNALIGALSAAQVHGLQNWGRDEVTVLVDNTLVFEPLPGFRFFRTRRSLARFRDSRYSMPVCRLEPALLLFAAYDRSRRTAQGVLAAAVQQRLTTAPELLHWLSTMQPLRRSTQFHNSLLDVADGAQSMGELDISALCRTFGLPKPSRQNRRAEASGRIRFTDCEWELPNGHIVILEVDGGFHMDIRHWEEDIARQRGLSAINRTIIRCTTRELRHNPARIAADLKRLGVALPPSNP